MTATQRIAAGSIAVGLLVLALKGIAALLTGSAALFSDALETVVNVVAAMVAFAALTLAARPADANHLYGHDKAEFFAAVIEGVLIVVAALVILRHAWLTWLEPMPIESAARGLLLNAAATALNAVWAWTLLRRGTRLRSPALRADGRHLAADVVASAGVAAGVALAVGTGRLWLDPLLGAATAIYILGAGVMVVRESVGGLMDAAPAAEIVERIRTLVGVHAEGAIEAHDLRTRQSGRSTYLEFHLVVPAAMTVAAAHDICDRIEAGLRAEMVELVITIHVEPEAKAKHQGVLVL